VNKDVYIDSSRRPVANNVMQWLFTRRCFLFTRSLSLHGWASVTPTHHMASSAKPSSSRSRAVRQWRRLRRQNALTRASVKLSDKLVRERRVRYCGPPLRIGIQQRVAAIIGLLAPEWATQPTNGQRQCYKKARFRRLACRHA